MREQTEHISSILKTLPDLPGVYQYFDKEGKIIYVGKAKNLKKRVYSYFSKDRHESGKTELLVKKISDIQTIVVETELDALLLENNLIKKYQPRYNINLKDDKTYPWICIKKENFPRVFSTRRVIKDGSEYFGPYASVGIMRTLLELIKEVYPLRTCTFDLSEKNISSHKFRECLDFHVGTCKAPCTAKQSKEDYQENISNIKNILKGNIASSIRQLKEKMTALSDNLEFEKAFLIKKRIESLENYQSRSTIVSSSINDIDVFSIVSTSDAAFVNFLKVMNGSIIQGHTIELKKKLEESDDELLLFGMNELRTRFQSTSKEIVVPFIPSLQLGNINYTVPKIGEKKQLLDLSARNADNFRREKEKQISLVDPERHTTRIMEQMKKDLHLKEEPRRIECFDNSNIQGAHAVSAMTVFIDGKPAKKEYRHFTINTVVGPDDFASMEEVIFRRYKRVQEEGLEFPQLVVIDGGKGQLSSAMHSLEKLGLSGKMAVIGIAKRLEEIYFPGDSIPIYLDKRSETLKIIQQIRDEAHRFGITHHRSKRSRETFKTELSEINGISEITAQKLLIAFKSVANIKTESLESLESAIGKSKAKLVWEYFNTQADQ